MKRFILLASALALIVLPTTALGASPHALVLSVSSRQHKIQLIERRHVVHGYSYAGVLPALHAGSRVRFRPAGTSIRGVAVAGAPARAIRFLGTVVRSSASRLVIRLGGGGTVTLAARSGWLMHSVVSSTPRRAAAPAQAFADTASTGFDPGLLVLVTETLSRQGRTTGVAIKPAGAASPGAGAGAGAGAEHGVSGVVTDLGSGYFAIRTGAGASVQFHMAAAKLAGSKLAPCDTVAVRYHQTAAELIADSVHSSGTSASGSCGGAGGGGSGGSGGSSGGGSGGSGGTGGTNGSTCTAATASTDVIGNVTSVSSSAITISTTSQGTMTFTLDDPTVTDGILAGDQVDVTYSLQADCSLLASDVEYNERDAVGTVAAVSSGSLTVVSLSTGQPQTFTADPSEQMFAGHATGDQVDVTYHLSSGQTVVDSVN